MKVSIIGATGYSGIELIRFLHVHPEVEIASVYSHSSSGKPLSELFPHITGLVDKTLLDINPDEIAREAGLVFMAAPAGVSSGLSPGLLKAGVKVIDLSGDFRLKDAALYREWYGQETASNEELQKAVYGLSEWYEEEVSGAQLVANPGCYPTATLLGLLPLLREQWVDPKTVIVDAKTGVSGAGRSPSLVTHFGEINESVTAYKVASHKHIPEIEQTLGDITGQEMTISFTPHLIPMTRGILSTIYATLERPVTADDCQQLFESVYGSKKFVRVRSMGASPKTKDVYGSNYCDLAVHVDERTNRVIVLSVIDNVVKGASGQAVQNMNLMCGWPQDTGLLYSPVVP